jgi:hypothetical protein
MMANDGNTSSMGGILERTAWHPVEQMAGSTRASYTPHTIRASWRMKIGKMIGND